MSQSPAASASGPTSWPAEVSRQAAANDSVADVTRICTRNTTGQTRRTLWAAVCGAPAEQPTHQEADQAEHAQIVPRRRSAHLGWSAGDTG